MQDPIIFAGSVRGNLDPNGDASSDADMWAALKQAGLKQMVQSLPVRSSMNSTLSNSTDWVRQVASCLNNIVSHRYLLAACISRITIGRDA